MKSKKAGFTLIEILIVVVIFAIVAIAVISAINPTELINRGRDTSTLQAVSQTYSAAIRSNTIRGNFPIESDLSGVALNSEEGIAFIDKLRETDEVKESFTNNQELNNIFLSANVDNQQIYLCFRPKSQAFYNHPLSGYDKFGQEIEQCLANECYVCVNGDNISLIGQPIDPGAARPTPTPAPPAEIAWHRATTGNNCNEYCQSIGKTCTEEEGSCPVFCFVTSGGNQVEARWADIFGIKDPATGYSCWGSYSCSTTFKYVPLAVFNARCCCK